MKSSTFHASIVDLIFEEEIENRTLGYHKNLTIKTYYIYYAQIMVLFVIILGN